MRPLADGSAIGVACQVVVSYCSSCVHVVGLSARGVNDASSAWSRSLTAFVPSGPPTSREAKAPDPAAVAPSRPHDKES